MSFNYNFIMMVSNSYEKNSQSCWINLLYFSFWIQEFIKESLKIYDGIHQYEARLAVSDSQKDSSQKRLNLNDAINSKSFYESIELLSSKVNYR